MDGGKHLLGNVLTCGGVGLLMTPFYSFLNKGSLADVVWGGKSLDRLRIFPKSGKRIVICKGGLGWTWEDIGQLESALTKVVEPVGRI